MRGWAAVALAAVLVAGCGGSKKPSGPLTYGSAVDQLTDAPTVTTTESGSGPTAGSGATAAPAVAASNGSFTVSFVNSRGAGVGGLVISVSGPHSQSATTDVKGNVALSVPPGVYDLSAAACSPLYFLQHSATARVTVPAGQHVTGRLVVAAVSRVAAVRPSDYQRVSPPEPVPGADAHWQVGQVYRVTFATQDRCTGKSAAGESFAALRFVPGAGYALVGTPPSAASASGTGTLQMTCTTANKPTSLLVEAAADPTDQVDLFSFDVLDRSQPDCGS